MLAKLALMIQISAAPLSARATVDTHEGLGNGYMRRPHIAAPLSLPVDSILYTPVVMCDAITLTKQLPVEILTHCAVKRVGWLKF